MTSRSHKCLHFEVFLFKMRLWYIAKCVEILILKTLEDLMTNVIIWNALCKFVDYVQFLFNILFQDDLMILSYNSLRQCFIDIANETHHLAPLLLQITKNTCVKNNGEKKGKVHPFMYTMIVTV